MYQLDTKLVRPQNPTNSGTRSALPPSYTSTVYEFTGEDSPEALRYPRLNNTPNQEALAAKLAAIEGAEMGIVTSSGLAAISSTLLALVPKGGHLLAQDGLYGGVMQFLQNDFRDFGREVTFVGAQDPASWAAALKPTTRVLYAESVSNPLLEIPDLVEMARFAREHGLLSLVDNTFPSPVNFQPLALGFDVCLHSATKYLNGHSDLVAGCVLGRRETLAPVLKLLSHLGGTLDSGACVWLDRGLKTLGVRVRHQNASALRLAEFLQAHPRVERVRYPGLASHPQHGRARELFRGFGGMIAFDFKGTVSETDAALRKLSLFFTGPSLGGPESLVVRPSISSHSWISAEDRARIGIRDTTVRVSVGLEDPSDLIDDLTQAFR